MASINLQYAWNQALQHHQNGQFQAAETLCRQILAQDPAHHDAMHLLGVIAYQFGRNDIAVHLIRNAIALNPRWPDANVNLGNVLLGLKQIDQAIAAYRQAIALRPGNADAYGNLGAALKEKGQLDDAIESYRKALELRPNYPEAHNNLGTALKEKGQLDDAINNYRRAIALVPGFPDAHCNLGSALKEMGLLDEAIAEYRQAIVFKPGYAVAHNNLGVALRQKGRLDDAIDSYRKAVAVKPDFGDAFSNLGNALHAKGLFDQALDAYRRAAALNPRLFELLTKPEATLMDRGRLDEATVYQQAIRVNPEMAELYGPLGVVLAKQGNIDGAIDAFRREIELKPASSEAHYNLGNVLRDKGDLDGALAAFRAAIARDGTSWRAYANMGMVLPNTGCIDEALAAFRQAVELNPAESIPHGNLVSLLNYHPVFDANMIAEEQRRWNERHAQPLARFIQPHLNDRNPDRRLRIGYVSADLRNHVVGRNLVPLLSHHDHEQFEIIAYADVPAPDAKTRQLQALCDTWHDIAQMSDERAANLIREHRIDILLDLAGHTAGNRLLLFARKPAPVQASWLGQLGSTGLQTIDYRFSDPYLDPPDANPAFHSDQAERILRLPRTYWCYAPHEPCPAVSALPFDSAGSVSLGCLNRFPKSTSMALNLWAKVMARIPGSRFLLYCPQGSTRQRVSAHFASAGIDPNRVEFQDDSNYLQRYCRIDIALDPVPQNGAITTCDALWMGVPVVTLTGATSAGRAGRSILSNIGLPELVASTTEEYVEIAVALAGDLDRLRELRSTLRDRMRNSSLMDAPQFARDVEALYRLMWRNWCQHS